MTEIERVVCGMVNCYLLMGEHGAVLVDTGETADRERIVAACRKKNGSIKNMFLPVCSASF